MAKYIDAEKLTRAIEDKGLDCSFALKMERLDTLALIDSLQQEHPEVDLEEEIDRMWSPRFNLGWDDNSLLSINHKSFEAIARHFYDLGCCRTAEKCDEIEYNRQRAEEQGSKGLEEEIIKCWQEWISPSNKQSVEGVLPLSEFAFYARHFAQWQKEQDEISKVNYEGARAVYDNTVQHLQEKIDEKYELGKKDMKEQMLKEAVEGVLVDNVDGTQEICLHGNRYGDKVRVIIVKEDEK